MRVIVWNVASLAPTVRNIVLKYGSLLGFFDHYAADIICFQETKMLEEKLTKELACVDGFESFWAISLDRKGYSGVATYVRLKYAATDAQADCLELGEDGEGVDREGRVLRTDHEQFVLFNIYAPNAGDRPLRPRAHLKVRFLEALQQKADALLAAGRQVIIVGDLNMAAGPADVHQRIGFEGLYSDAENAAMASLLRSYTDSWRRLHPEETSVFTVWDEKTSARAFNEGVRIDFALLSPGLLDRLVSCEVLPTHPKWSDHAAVLLELRDPPLLADAAAGSADSAAAAAAVAPRPPAALSSRRMRRFNDPSQRSVAAMFGRKRLAAAPSMPDSRSPKRPVGVSAQEAAPQAGAGKPVGARAAEAGGTTTSEQLAQRREGVGNPSSTGEGGQNGQGAAATSQPEVLDGSEAGCLVNEQILAPGRARKGSSGGRTTGMQSGNKKRVAGDAKQPSIQSFFSKSHAQGN